MCFIQTKPNCSAASLFISGGYSETTSTIDYTYDPLYRLTAADYSTGEYFHYTYDAVGNRLAQESSQQSAVSYQYDAANRLTSVDGVSYTWDANGNLLSDGTDTYTYDSANRLMMVNGPSSIVQMAYNGLGDRLQQTVDGQATNYTLDINTGLTQVLDDGTETYLYGAGRIAQASDETEYFLGDALGSVRQLTDETGTITYTANYDPYGDILSKTGSSQTSMGYTGEQQDSSTGMVYLRARYYSPYQGRFMTRDTWGGDANKPMSFNAWLYVYGNPVNGLDPSGRMPDYCTEVDSSDWSTTPGCPGYTTPPYYPPYYSDVTYASSIPSNTDQVQPPYVAQYYRHQRPDGAKYKYHNLCGHLSAEIVIEAITGRPYDINNLINHLDTWRCNEKGCGDTGTEYVQLGRLLAQTLGQEARVFSYYKWQVQEYTVDEAGNPHLYESKLRTLSTNWWLDEQGKNIAKNIMEKMLRSGHFLIVAGVLDTVTGFMADHMNESGIVDQPRYVGHWVVLRSLNGDSVSIVNPYFNRIEWYSWSGLFKGSMEKGGPYWMLDTAPNIQQQGRQRGDNYE